MKLLTSPVEVTTLNKNEVKFLNCRCRTCESYVAGEKTVVASLQVEWEDYAKLLNTWRKEGARRKSNWLANCQFITEGLTEARLLETWKLFSPFLVDEASSAGVAFLHMRRIRWESRINESIV